jgi:hypothetical protein
VVAAADQGIVQRVGEVWRSIDERPVEIENDGRISQIGARHVFILSWLLR